MKKKKKNNDINDSGVSTPRDSSVKSFNWLLLIMLVGNTAVIFGIYRFMMNTAYFLYVLVAYLALAALISVIFVVYNRAFTRRGVTPDMLPDSMTPEEKSAFISDGEARLKKSKWMLTLILPFLVTFTYEVFELFVFDYFKNLFNWL